MDLFNEIIKVPETRLKIFLVASCWGGLFLLGCILFRKMDVLKIRYLKNSKEKKMNKKDSIFFSNETFQWVAKFLEDYKNITINREHCREVPCEYKFQENVNCLNYCFVCDDEFDDSKKVYWEEDTNVNYINDENQGGVGNGK